ncbi:unnamed protein product [Penicillium camemberti]|uniref:Str. FM013 n=1 Tax=Penicillium camemberti (strain FM 013) TaxID=1429867 RepID=A0A0G4PX71_PENC3|nr:unnamed protein product [Penicillium camemberti]
MSSNLTTRKPRSRRPKLEEHAAIEKLRNISSLVYQRRFLKDHERKRASEALALMAAEPIDDKYQRFLFNVKRESKLENSAPLATLCAIALGKDVIKSAKEDILMNLPQKIAALEADLVNDVLKGDLANTKETAFQTPSELSHDIFAHDRESVPLDLQLGELIDFLREYEGLDKTLRMSFPLSGHPLPSIYFASQQPGYADAKVEFSQPLATTFIRHVMKRRQL